MNRIYPRAALTAAVAGTCLVGALATAGAASASAVQASHARKGFVTVLTCGAVAGNIAYQPGLTPAAQAVNATLTGFVSDCAGLGGHLAGLGTIKASLSGTAGVTSENFSGTFTINWPGGTIPSTGTLGISQNGTEEVVSGSITSGPQTGGELQMTYLITGHKGAGTATHPMTSQSYIDDNALTVMVNIG